MAFYCILGLGIYLLFKRNPEQGKNVLQTAHNAVKYMPIDKSAMDMFNPILDFTPTQFLEENENDDNINTNGLSNSSEQRILRSGSKGTKRSVSETKKKYVASMQDWKCKHCKKTLTAWFEVDHVKRLEHGGNNDVTNLVALCRECHGQKTAFENM
jgi:rubredoxin